MFSAIVHAASLPEGSIKPYNKSLNNNRSPLINLADVPFLKV